MNNYFNYIIYRLCKLTRSNCYPKVVWKSSKKVGCGISTKNSETWVCCNYDPPGNYGGQFEANVLPLKPVV